MSVCLKCRIANQHCPHENEEGAIITTPRNWRPPRKTHEAAWRRIERGDLLWDHKAVERAAKRRAGRSWAFWEEYNKKLQEIARVFGVKKSEAHKYFRQYRLMMKEREK